MHEIKMDYAALIPSLAEVNEKCQMHITRYYPLGKQLTIARVGSESDQLKMYNFIDACLFWANQEKPKIDDLLVIRP